MAAHRGIASEEGYEKIYAALIRHDNIGLVMFVVLMLILLLILIFTSMAAMYVVLNWTRKVTSKTAGSSTYKLYSLTDDLSEIEEEEEERTIFTV